jgi:hypothetical protein
LLGLIDSLAYASRGSISTKAISLLFPLLAIMYLRRLDMRVICAALLVATSLAKAGVFYADSYVVGPHGTGSTYGQTLPSWQWMQTHASRKRFTLLADLNLFGSYLADAANTPYRPINAGFTPSTYARVVQPLVWSHPPDLIAVDTRSSQPLTGFLFQLFDPLRRHLGAMESNGRLDVIYDDGSIMLVKPIETQSLRSGQRSPQVAPPFRPGLALSALEGTS